MSDFFSKLQADMPALIESGVVTKPQAAKLLAHYQAEADEPTASKLVPILSIIGSVFVGAGFVLYFASNWDIFPDWAKLAILVTAVVATYAAAFVLLFVRGYPKTGHAMALLGSILYGASIFLVGQTYNLGGTFPQALLLWLAGVLPIAYVSGLSSFPYFLSILFGVWLFADVTEVYSDSSDMLVWFPAVVGVLLAGVSVWHSGRFEQFRRAYFRVGIFGIFSGLFLFTFGDFLNNSGGWSHTATVFTAFFSAGALAYVVKIVRDRDFSRASLYPAFHLLVLSLFAVVSHYAFAYVGTYGYSYHYDLSAPLEQTALLIFTNLYFLGFCIAVAALGLARKSPYVVNVSLAFVTVFVFAKYFDWFFEMMDRALFFILGGTLFVLVGWQIERRRKILLKSISK